MDGKIRRVVRHAKGRTALVAGGLDPRFTFIASGVPAICDHSGRAAGPSTGWPNLCLTARRQPDPRILEASRTSTPGLREPCQAEAS